MTFPYPHHSKGQKTTMRPTHYLPLLALFLLTLAACGDDDDSTTPGGKSAAPGSLPALCTFVGEEAFAVLQDFNFNFHPGTDPLDFSGEFLIDLMVQETSNIPGDTRDGDSFNTALFSFADLDPATRSLTYNSVDQAASSTDAYYSAAGDDFNVLVRLPSNFGGVDIVRLYAISGTLTPDGIADIQYVLYMVDDNGDPNDLLIEPGQARLLVDEDGLAVRR